MRRALVPLLACVPFLGAEEQPAAGGDRTIVAERVSGIPTFRDWLLASPLAQQWEGKDAESARQAVDDALDKIQKEEGLDARAVLRDFDQVRVQFVVAAPGAPEDEPFGVRLSVSLPKTADDVWRALAAEAKPDGAELVLPNSGRFGRSGTWLTFARGCSAVTVADQAPAAAQIAGVFDLDAVWEAAKLPDAAAVARAFALGKGSFSSTVLDEGSRDQLSLEHARLPLAPIDPAALAALPVDAMTVEAIGLDGKRLDEALTAMGKGSKAVGDAIARAEGAFAALELGELRPLLRSLSGTAVLGITNGVPFPGVTLMLPASKELDAALDALGSKAGIDLGEARTQAVMVPLPPQMPLLLQVRRTKTHWVASTDPAVLDRAAQDKPDGGFDAAAKLAQLGDRLEARFLWCQDNQAQARMLQGFMAAGASQAGGRQSKEQAEAMRLTAKLLADLGPKLKPTVLAVVEGGDGTRVEARNAVMQVSSVAVLAGMMLPAINMTREAARRSSSGNHERQLVLVCLVYQNENEKWPLTIEELVQDPANDMPKDILVSPSAPELAGAYLYVRPTNDAPATQPVIVEDPACNRHRHGSMVAYADGHVEFVPGTGLWDAARRLSQLPKAKEGGVEAADWPATPAPETSGDGKSRKSGF